MRTEIKRALVTALVATVFVGGCERVPEAFSTKTPEEIKQLTAVTDAVVSLARSVDDSSKREAIRQTVAAVAAADAQYQWHGDAIVNTTNAATLGCIDAHGITVLDLETLLARLDEAVQQQDEKKIAGRRGLLQELAMNATGCATQSTQFLIGLEKRPEALEHGAVLISGIFAIASSMRAAGGLSIGLLLEEQVRNYETVVARLGDERDVPIITDALPKLREAVAVLKEANSVADPHRDPSPDTAAARSVSESGGGTHPSTSD